MESFSDNILNAFAKIKNIDPKFKDLEDNINKYEYNFNLIFNSNLKLIRKNTGKII